MKVELRNIESFGTEVTLHLEDGVYFTDFDQLDLQKYIDFCVDQDDTIIDEEHLLELQSYDSLIQDLLAEMTFTEVYSCLIGKFSCCGDEVELDTDLCPSCKEHL